MEISRNIKSGVGKETVDELFEQLDDSSRLFIGALIEGGAYSLEDLEPWIKLILEPSEVVMDRIQKALEGLADYGVDSETAVNPYVQKGYQELRTFIEINRDDLKEIGIIGIVLSGSMIYDDPKNLDLDLLVLTQDEVDIDVIRDYEKILSWYWGRVSGAGIDFYFLNIGRLEKYLNAFGNDSVLLQRDCEYIDVCFDQASIILNGNWLFVQKDRKRDLQYQIMKYGEENPVLGAWMGVSLEETVLTRQKRRQDDFIGF